MLNTPFPPWPSFTVEEADAVRDVLLSNRVNQWTGEHVGEFECAFAGYTGSRYAIALANGTLALDLALQALDIGEGHEVIVTPRTFIASISSVVNCGATPVFADVERNSGNVSAATIEAVLTPATRAVVVVHLAGFPVDMEAVMALANARGIDVIEDCAQAHGARWNGRSVGTFGKIGAWSFCQDKIMSTGGEGGMVTTDDESLWRRMWAYKDHGKSYEAVFERDHEPGFRWLHESFGTNWRMTEMQAVIGRIQTARLPEWHRRRLENATTIWEACGAYDWLRVSESPESAVHAAYKAYVYVRPERLPADWTRNRIVDEIVKQGVPAYTGSCSEAYLERAFDGTGWPPGTPLANAHELGETSLMFLVHPTLEAKHIARTVAAVAHVDSLIRQARDAA